MILDSFSIAAFSPQFARPFARILPYGGYRLRPNIMLGSRLQIIVRGS